MKNLIFLPTCVALLVSGVALSQEANPRLLFKSTDFANITQRYRPNSSYPFLYAGYDVWSGAIKDAGWSNPPSTTGGRDAESNAANYDLGMAARAKHFAFRYAMNKDIGDGDIAAGDSAYWWILSSTNAVIPGFTLASTYCDVWFFWNNSSDN